MKSMQRALYCRCGKEKVLAHGLCATCYTLKRQDQEYFGGLREKVLERANGFGLQGAAPSRASGANVYS